MRFLLPLLAVAVVLLTAPDALAAAAPDAHGHGEKAGGLAFLQLHRYDLGIFTLVVFGLLYVILAKTAWPKITEGLQKREAAILGAREDAVKARAEAEDLRARLQKEAAEAQDKIRALLDEARRDADALRTAEKEAGVKEAQAERDRARRDIEAAKDSALDEIYRTAVDLATSLTAKTIGRQISADDHRKLLDESLAELKQGARSA